MTRRVPVRTRRRAREHLLEIADHISRDNGQDVGLAFLTSAERTFRRLAERPEMGRLCSFAHKRLAGVRRWRIERFPSVLVFYRILKTGIEVVDVFHGARDWPSLLDDERSGESEVRDAVASLAMSCLGGKPTSASEVLPGCVGAWDGLVGVSLG